MSGTEALEILLFLIHPNKWDCVIIRFF